MIPLQFVIPIHLASVGPTFHANIRFGDIPWWEWVILVPVAMGFVIYARRGRPPEPDKASKEEDDAISGELRELDRNLGAQTIGTLQLLAIVLGGLVVASEKMSSGLFAANGVMISTCMLLAFWALTMVGGPTMVVSLEGHTRRDLLIAGAKRVHRRARVLRTASWCMMPTLILFGVSILHALTKSPS